MQFIVKFISTIIEALSRFIEFVPESVLMLTSGTSRFLPLLHQITHRFTCFLPFLRIRIALCLFDQFLFQHFSVCELCTHLIPVLMLSIKENLTLCSEFLPQCFITFSAGRTDWFPFLHQLIHFFACLIKLLCTRKLLSLFNYFLLKLLIAFIAFIAFLVKLI